MGVSTQWGDDATWARGSTTLDAWLVPWPHPHPTSLSLTCTPNSTCLATVTDLDPLPSPQTDLDARSAPLGFVHFTGLTGGPTCELDPAPTAPGTTASSSSCSVAYAGGLVTATYDGEYPVGSSLTNSARYASIFNGQTVTTPPAHQAAPPATPAGTLRTKWTRSLSIQQWLLPAGGPQPSYRVPCRSW